MDKYTPTDEDISHTRRLWGHLKIGGLWSYDDIPVAMRKESETEALVLSFGFDDASADGLCIVLGACGITAKKGSKGEIDGYGW